MLNITNIRLPHMSVSFYGTKILLVTGVKHHWNFFNFFLIIITITTTAQNIVIYLESGR